VITSEFHCMCGTAFTNASVAMLYAHFDECEAVKAGGEGATLTVTLTPAPVGAHLGLKGTLSADGEVWRNGVRVD
jgi:hypothetical protein